jgi:hypothetical protein
MNPPEIRKAPVSREMPYYDWSLDESVRYLRWLLAEFPFADWKEHAVSDNAGGDETPVRNSRSQAVQIAAMLSLFCAALLRNGANRMGFVYTANSQRSGKSLLAKLVIMPIYGSFKGLSWKNSDDELSKVIDAELLTGSIYLCFDNVRGYVASPTLEALMTSPSWSGRILKETRMFEVKNRKTLFITGNDCILSPDMAHRCLICNLHVNEGNVQDRQPSWVLDEEWLLNEENKRCVLSALWGILRAWARAGKQSATSFGCKPRLGFERWCDIIGGIVAFAGFGDCLETPPVESGGNTEEGCIRNLIDYLRVKTNEQRQEFEFKEICQICHDEGLFEWMLEGSERDGVFTPSPKCRSALGRMLSRYAPSTDENKAPRKYVVAGKAYCFGTRDKGRKRRYFMQEAA